MTTSEVRVLRDLDAITVLAQGCALNEIVTTEAGGYNMMVYHRGEPLMLALDRGWSEALNLNQHNHEMERREMDDKEFLANFEQADGSWPTSFIPQPGDWIYGWIEEFGEYQGQFGVVPTVTIRCDQGMEGETPLNPGERYSFWISGDVLRSQFERLTPRVGDKIAIKRVPDGISQKWGKPYKSFVVRVQRPDDEHLEQAFDASTIPGGDSGGDASFTEPDDDMPF